MRRGKSAVTGAGQVTTSSRVIKSTNIRTWVHSHTEEETLELISSGHVIHFEEENLKTSDAMVMTVLQTAYIFFEAERERRSDRAIEAYYRRVEAGVYIPHTLLGYVLYIKAISRYIVHKYSAQHSPYGRSILMVFGRVSSYYI